MTEVRVRAFAKINLTLRVVGVRPDGFHALRTVFQSIALHDTVTCRRTPGPFRLAGDDPACPAGEDNLVWRAARQIWTASKRRGPMRGVTVRLRKRLPVQAGVGGGSSDAAAALRALAALWRVRIAPDRLRAMAAALGADVPYFLEGGTVLGVERGDLLFPLADLPPYHVVVVVPPFGVSTKDAFAWWDAAAGRAEAPAAGRAGRRPAREVPGIPGRDLVNDLQGVVARHHPEIARIARALDRAGAVYAAMSGSGSAVFGLFAGPTAAGRAAARVAGPGRRVLLTRTIGRKRFGTAGQVAEVAAHRIHSLFAPRGEAHS